MTLETRLKLSTVYEWLLLLLSGLLMVPLAFILFYLIKQGITAINWTFLTSLPKPVGETGGGVSNAIVGTLIIVAIASIIAIPLGMLIGIFTAENKTARLADAVRIAIDTLQGIPSIVIGIIAYTWVVRPMGGFSAFSGGIALAFIMLPLVAKSTEETVKLIPDTLKEASYALGAPYYKTILFVVIPSSINGIIAGILLGIARICGETAPLLFTAFGNPFMSLKLQKAINALPLLIFNYATSPYDDWQQLAWGASLLLIGFVLFLSLLAKVVIRK